MTRRNLPDGLRLGYFLEGKGRALDRHFLLFPNKFPGQRCWGGEASAREQSRGRSPGSQTLT